MLEVRCFLGSIATSVLDEAKCVQADVCKMIAFCSSDSCLVSISANFLSF